MENTFSNRGIVMAKYSDNKDFKVIALCTAKFYGSEEIELFQALTNACRLGNYRVVIFSTFSDFYAPQIGDASEQKIFSLLEPEKYDAVVISTETFKTTGLAEGIAKRCIAAGVPVFSLIKPLEGCINLSFGYGEAFEKIVRHLVEEHNFTKFVFIAGMRNNSFSQTRIDCFLKVLQEHNIPFNEDDLYYGDFWEGPTADAMEEYFASGKPLPEAFVCANDFMAMEVCRKLQDHGYDVPTDVTVTGFDGVVQERFNYPRLTTAEQDLQTLAELLLEAIEDCIAGRPTESNRIIPFKFRKSVSCGCGHSFTSTSEFKQLGISYSQANREMREFVSVFESYFELTAKYAHSETLYEIFPRLVKHLRVVNVSNFFLMLNDDFINKYEEHLDTSNSSVYSNDTDKQYYTDNMIAAMNYRDGVMRPAEAVKLSELAPDFGELVEKNITVLFTSLHVMGKTLGYVVNTLDAEKSQFATYYGFLMSLRQILETHKVKQDLDTLYSQDLLTKLYNRRGFYNRISGIFDAAKKEEKQFSFISIDLNWLKQINDTFGHTDGDAVLVAVANAMKHATVEGEICARFGGDEFAIGISCENAEERSREIISAIREEIAEGGRNKKYNQSVSIGFWAAVPGSRQELGEFIRLADERMYIDKKRIKGMGTWLRT